MAGKAPAMHQGHYFEKAGSEKIDIETEVSESE